MRGVIVSKPNAAFEVVDNIAKPSPGPREMLVKSLVAGMNPMENFMQGGLLVEEWPIVLGCDTSSIVVEVGKDVTGFEVGDEVFGPVRVGFVGYMAFQEFFLMEEKYTFKKPENVSTEQTATLSIASLTASLGLVTGLHLELPGVGEKAAEKDEWIVILGGAGSVGQMAIMIAKLGGYKVLASASASNTELVKNVGADATFDYKNPLATQLENIKAITGANFSKVFDASASSLETASAALARVSSSKDKQFSTVDDWSQIAETTDFEIYRIDLGQLGRSGTPLADEVDREVTKAIPHLQRLFSSGDLKPLDFVVAGEGFEGVAKALEVMNSGKVKGKKIVVRLQYK